MTAWTPATWTGAIEASPFELVATYDGGTSGEWPESTRRRRAGSSGTSWRSSGRHVRTSGVRPLPFGTRC